MTSTEKRRINVHNHGTEEGPGLSCKEFLVGECQIIALRSELERVKRELSKVHQRIEYNRKNHGR